MPKNTVPAAGEAMPKIASLFAGWQHQMKIAASAPEDKADEQIDIAAQIDRRMNEMKPVTAADFAMKLLVVTGNGDFQPTPELIEEAKALAAADTTHEPGPSDTAYARSCTVYSHLEEPTDNAARIASILARTLEGVFQADMTKQGMQDTYFIPKDQMLDILFAATRVKLDLDAVHDAMHAAAAEVGR